MARNNPTLPHGAGHRTCARFFTSTLAAVLVLFGLTSSAAAQNKRRLVEPRQISAPMVPYPEGAQGDAEVRLELLIDEQGSVAEATVREGSDPFGGAARRSAMNWRFQPARRNGVPVMARRFVNISFEEPPPLIHPLEAAIQEGASDEEASDEGASDESLLEPLAPEPIADVVVRSERRPEIGGTLIPYEEARLIPGTFADPFRVAEVLPGIAPILSGLPYFFIRGAPPGNVAYMIDGIRVPLLFHVGAGPSIIAPSLVERVDVIPSAYPARFGRSAGGVIAGETMLASPVARGEFQARVFDASALLEVPFADDRASVLVAGRYSYVQPLLDRVSPDYELAYWDYQARAGYQLSASNTISVFAFGASDQLTSRPLQRQLFDTSFHRIDLRWDRTTEGGQTRIALTAGADRIANAEDDPVAYASHVEDQSLRLRWATDQDIARGVVLRAGMDYGVNRVSREQDTRPDEVASFPERADLSGNAYLDAIFRAPGVEVVPGVRTDAALSRNKGYFFVEPRLATRLHLFGGLSWISQLGVAHQLPTQSVRIPGQAADPLEAAVQEAWQTAQGLELVFSSGLTGKVTAFHSWVDASELDRTGRSYGIEAFLRREFAAGLGGILSYTLSRTEATSRRVTTPSEFDRTHVISAVLGWNLGAGVRVGLRGYYASGRRYIVACPTPECAPGGEPDAPRVFAVPGRLPDFYRADFRIEKRWEIGYTSWLALTMEWFNATLSKETTGVDWSPSLGKLLYNERDALTLPSLGIEGGF